MSSVLAIELETYSAKRDELLGEAEGRYVLIHENSVEGVYDTEHDAIVEGYRRLGNVPFLVKRVVAVEVPARFVSNLIAL